MFKRFYEFLFKNNAIKMLKAISLSRQTIFQRFHSWFRKNPYLFELVENNMLMYLECAFKCLLISHTFGVNFSKWIA